MADIVIRNGTVVDGSGARGVRADVVISGDTIVDVGQFPGAQAPKVVDATGHVVCPGFVDMHSHADFTLPILPTAESLVHQGITTIVPMQCGSSPAPILPERREELARVLAGDDPETRLPFEKWSTFGSYLDYLMEIGISLNVVPLVGQSTVRMNILGFTANAPDDRQMARMQAEVVRAMDEGAVGITTGLIYPPGSFAKTPELVDITRPVGQRNGFYFSHIRGESGTLMEALEEAIHIGRETKSSVEISHFKVGGRENWGKAPAALAIIDKARAQGQDVTADMYPYPAGSTGLVSMLPEWTQEGGNDAILQRLRDSQMRKDIARDMRTTGYFKEAEWDKVLISGSPNKEYEGRYVAELAADARKTPHDWVFDALIETNLDISMIVFMMSEENIKLQLKHPVMMVGTDGVGLKTEGPMFKGLPHPRSYGTFPRILGHYARSEKVLSLEEAVHKMSGLAARKLRWSDRGLLKRGFKADVVVFDPKTVADAATFQKPHQYPIGIPHVLVNGRLVIHGGAHTGARPGGILGSK